jgi:hypothetical protein
MTARLVYLAGPYSCTDDEIAANVKAACEWGLKVRALGLVPVVPHITIVPHEDLTWGQAMQECFAILSRCDAVLMLPGWDKSRGAVAERNFAEDEAMPIFEGLSELEKWKEEVA